MSIFNKIEGAPDYRIFFCPGCEEGHQVIIAGVVSPNHPVWGWNGSEDKPTITPSIRVTTSNGICHSFIKDGQIQFLADCWHAFRGCTVHLPDMDNIDGDCK